MSPLEPESRDRILLVENDPDAVELARRAFELCDVANPIAIARDGVEACEQLLGEGAREPALVLLDLDLPRMGGLEVLERLRASARLVPIIVLSTSDERRDVIDAYRKGANSYVRKPISFSEFADVLGQIVRYWLVLNRGTHGGEGSA